jgi:hypothetical protein
MRDSASAARRAAWPSEPDADGRAQGFGCGQAALRQAEDAPAARAWRFAFHSQYQAIQTAIS